MRPGDPSKLPKWAQERLKLLEERIIRLESDVCMATGQTPHGGQPFAFTFHSLLGAWDRKVLPASWKIEAWLPGGRRVNSVSFGFREGEHALEINGAEALRIEPRATNSIYVRLREFS